MTPLKLHTWSLFWKLYFLFPVVVFSGRDWKFAQHWFSRAHLHLFEHTTHYCYLLVCNLFIMHWLKIWTSGKCKYACLEMYLHAWLICIKFKCLNLLLRWCVATVSDIPNLCFQMFISIVCVLEQIPILMRLHYVWHMVWSFWRSLHWKCAAASKLNYFPVSHFVWLTSFPVVI